MEEMGSKMDFNVFTFVLLHSIHVQNDRFLQNHVRKVQRY